MKYGHNSGGVWRASEDRKPTREYSRWATLMARIYNPKHKAYHQYGGRGVAVCSEWHDFQVFAQWFSEHNIEGWCIDKDLHGGVLYSPATCVFIPEQVNQLLKCYENPTIGVGKSTHTWYVKTVDIDGDQHYKGGYKTQEEACEYYQWHLREKMGAMIVKYNIHAAIAARLLSL